MEMKTEKNHMNKNVVYPFL